MPATPLSPRNERQLAAVFSENEQPVVRELLENECGTHISGWESAGLERLRASLLKLSEGDLSTLRSWIETAKVDFRDVLVAAGFADQYTHMAWSPGGHDDATRSLIRWMLSLTPAERLKFAEGQMNAVLRIRELNGNA